ncbi:MAG: glycosyltransferase [Hespellia sp.]|nr:glycosyltransferase [Hespellia sp.]
MSNTSHDKVSILMLTYNAPSYVYKSIRTLQMTKDVDYELIVVDNHSKLPTRLILKILSRMGRINKLILNKHNALFAGGNNIAAAHARSDSNYYLLLNSDIQINSSDWLSKLIELNEGGISSFGIVENEPYRVDGYCMLIESNLYNKFKLDENFQWWWSVTKLQAQVLNDGYRIRGLKDHEHYIHHFGGKSGQGFKDAKGMDVDMNSVLNWFEKGTVEFL